MYLSSYKNVFARGKDSGVKNGAKMQRQRPKEPKSCSSTAQSASNEINFHPKTVCLLHTFQNLLKLSTFLQLMIILIPIPPRLLRASSSSLKPLLQSCIQLINLNPTTSTVALYQFRLQFAYFWVIQPSLKF